MTVRLKIAVILLAFLAASPAWAQATISIQATDAAAAEPGNDGEFTVSLSETNNTGSAVTVNYSVGGNATSGTDYTALGSSVSIANGQISKTIPVEVLDNTGVEGAETVVVTLTGPTSGPFVVDTGNDSDTVTISADGSGQVSISATDATAAEPGNDGEFTVSLSETNNTGSAVTVNYSVGGNATSGTDYTALGSSVSIANGQISKTIPVEVLNNTGVEGAETVVVTLTGPTSVRLLSTPVTTVTR